MTEPAAEPLFDAGQWQRLRALIEQLDALDADARARALTEIARTDPGLAKHVQALLGSAPETEVEDLCTAVQRTLFPAVDDIPECIGPFRLVHPIGSGGMGTVFLGERSTAEFTQRVALKVLNGDAARVSRMVARERRALASLNHPNITAFIDAGTDAGCAWLAMEYVAGESLLVHCVARKLGISERVLLFEQICAAVAHAHSHLIVHRDLKPTNVLVTAEGTVKLLDFGIALILDPTADQTPATRVFTPEYAAPEQLRGERVTTATDIHALGLILFELVAGARLPLREAERSATPWRASELARAAHETASSEAIREMRGDLGRILAHALAPDPAQRYGSASQMREDLQRWREHRPLAIARPSFRYIATHFIRRNRALVATAVIALLALIGTTAFALWKADEATRMASRAEHAKGFLASLLTDTNPFNPGKGGVSSGDLIDRAAQRLDTEFKGSPTDQIELRQILAASLMRIGEPARSVALQRRNLEQLRERYGADSPRVAEALNGLAQATEDSGDIDAAQGLFEQAWAILEHAGDEHRKQRLTTMTGLAKMANRRSEFAQGQRWYERVLHERLIQEGPESPNIAMDIYDVGVCLLYQEKFPQARDTLQRARAMLVRTVGEGHARFMYVDLGLGLAMAETGEVDAAIQTISGALALARSNLKPGATHIGNILSALARAHWFALDDPAAIAAATESREILAAAKSPGIGTVELMLGRAELRMGNRQALQTLETARQHLQAGLARQARSAKFLAVAGAALGAAHARFGDAEQGEREAREARAQLLRDHPEGGTKLAEIDVYLAEILFALGKTDEARAARGRALATLRRLNGEAHPLVRALIEAQSN